MPESLLRRVATGDQSAVEQVLDQYGGLVWSLARRFCGNAADAEDAAQEAFIDLWQSAGRFDETLASESTFVAMIARRRMIDRVRQATRRPAAASLPSELAVYDPQRPDRVELQDEVDRVSRAMESLRPEQRQVLKLSICEGLSHEDIAQSTGFPLGTVKTHARRGLIRIRELIGGAAAQRQQEGRA